MSLIAAATNPGLLMGLSAEDSYLNLQWPPREVASSESLMNVLGSYAESEMPPKYQWVSQFVDVAARENRKVLIWSTFVGNLRALQRLLAPYHPAMIHGSTPLEERKRELRRFREDPTCAVLITNPQTLGEGISLHQVCHDAIYIDRSYNAGLFLQSIDRIHRLGLSREQETRVYLLSTEGTIDQRVALRLEAKIRRLAAAMDDPDLVQVSLPDDELVLDSAAVLGIDIVDLNDLFDHLRVTKNDS
jgi:SNF2 family DNA or RNA helicase